MSACAQPQAESHAGRLSTAQLRIAALYRHRAHQRMTWARAARNNGHPEAVRALVDEARLRTRFASDWARNAQAAQA